jgi:hypothetical protein
VPFLLSFVLIVIGYYVRRRVEESPVFAELAERKEETRMPIVAAVPQHAARDHRRARVRGQQRRRLRMTTGGTSSATPPTRRADRTRDRRRAGRRHPVAVTWLVFTFLSGWISDRIGRRTTYIIGWLAQLAASSCSFRSSNTGSIVLLTLGLVVLTVRLGFTYGPQAALYAELFPASIRFSGVSISYAIGAILGGALRSDDRAGDRAGDGFHDGRHLVPRRHDLAGTDRHAAAARPQRHPARTRP